MIIDYATIVWLFIAAVLVGVLIAVALTWRRLMDRSAKLPLWRFIRRSGVERAAVEDDLGTRAVREAELRCGVCASQEECEHRLRSTDGAPVPHCPNAALFSAIRRK